MKTAPSPAIHPGYRLVPAKFRYRVALGPKFLRDPLGFLERCVQECGDLVAVSPGRVLFVNHPDHIKHVLQDNHPNYRKGRRMTAMLEPFFGQGLITSEGEFWKRQRRLAQLAFHRRQSAELTKLMVDSIHDKLDHWERSGGEYREMREELTELTLDILLRGLLGTDWGEDPKALLHAVEELEEALALATSFSDPLRLPLWAPTPRNQRTKRALRSADHCIYRLITARRAQPPGNDLLSLMMAARDPETGEAMSDRQLRDELLTMLRAGHSTVRESILWTWHLLTSNPGAEKRFYEEIDSVLGARTPALEDLSRLSYTTMAFQESMRLYPPAWVFVREAIADDEIGGCRVAAGSMVVLCPYITQRSEAWWPDPEKFDPERFTPERSEARPRFAYYPFGGGPRQCIGSSMATMEAQLVLAMTAQRFRLERSGEVRKELFVSLMAHGLKLKMIPRRPGG